MLIGHCVTAAMLSGKIAQVTVLVLLPRLSLHRQCHAKFASLTDLLIAGDSNAEHFFVASQDAQLRGKLKQLPAGASIFASVNGIHLEAPSPQQRLAAGQVVHLTCQPLPQRSIC